MSTTVRRGLVLLLMAFGALLLGLAATANDAPVATTQVLGLAVLVLGVAGVALVALGLLRR